MKKITTLFVLLLVCVMSLWAQSPESFSYQAVVRNQANQLVANAQVGVRVSILQHNADGSSVFIESHTVTSNTNGLITIQIGGGQTVLGNLSDLNWAEGPYFLKTEIDPDGGVNYTITSTQQLLSVPYALYAKEAGNGFSGNISDYLNTATMPAVMSALTQAGVAMQSDIPTVPTNVSAFTNDAGYITMDSIPAIPTVPTNVSAFANDAGYITSAALPTVPSNVSAFTNDAGYLTGYTETDPQFNAWDKSYNDLTNKPTIPTVPTNVSAFTNDAGYITMDSIPAIPTVPTNVSAFANDAGYITSAALPTVPSNVSAFTNDAGYLTGYTETDPQFNAWDKSYNDLTNKPTIPTVPTNVSAFTNDAGYITMDSIPAIPTVPTNVSAFANDAGYITSAALPTVPSNVSAFTNDAGYLTGYTETDPQFNAWDKSYNDLTNKPTIPTVPTNVSAFTNDAGYLTSYTEQQVLSISNDTLFLTGGSFVKLPAGFDGNYNSLTNQPELFSGDYNDLTNQPSIPTVPSNVGAFTNDAGYVSNANCDSVQFCDILARLNAMQAEIDALKAAMAGTDTTQTDTAGVEPVNPSDTTVVPGPIDPRDTIDINPCPTAPKVMDFDGNEYRTVQFGNQCWLRENLRSKHYANGEAIPLYESFNRLVVLPAGRFYPDNDPSKLGTYGYLYSYDAATYNYNIFSVGPLVGACPAGWHLPTAAEWDSLFAYIAQWDSLRCNNESSQVVKALASTVGWNPSTTECAIGWNPEDNNATGFSIKPAGYVENGPYGVYGENVGLASGSAAYIFGNGTVKKFSADGTTVTTENPSALGSLLSRRAASVRCVQNKPYNGNLDNILPAVVTTDSVAISVTDTSAICKGEVIDKGASGGTIGRGICWGTSANPTTSGNHIASGSGLGAFTVKLTGLAPSTTYHFRAYVTNYRGTTYGADWTFTTQEAGFVPTVVVPTVITGEVETTAVTANVTGTVTNDGYSEVTERGFCWDTLPNPTVSGAHSSNSTGFGAFSQLIVNLQPATTYYVRAYATNSAGTGYGENVTFTTDTMAPEAACGRLRVEDVDGNFYNTVLIGTQCWLKENLKTTHYTDGTEIPLSSSMTAADASYFYPGGNANNVADYGLLYNWAAAMHGGSASSANPSGVQGICPDGWHLPSNTEFNALLSYVSSVPEYRCAATAANNAKALADTALWAAMTWGCTPGLNPSENNATGFSARPASLSNAITRVTRDAWFMSSNTIVMTQAGTGAQSIRPLMFRIYTSTASNAVKMVQDMSKQDNVGASVRCVKNE